MWQSLAIIWKLKNVPSQPVDPASEISSRLLKKYQLASFSYYDKYGSKRSGKVGII